MPIEEMKCESEQLFVFNRWGDFVGVAYSTIALQKNAENIAYDIVRQTLTEIATVLNNEAKHG